MSKTIPMPSMDWSNAPTVEYQLQPKDLTLFISVHLPVKVLKSPTGEWKCERTKHISTEAFYASRAKFGSRLLFVGSCGVPNASVEDKTDIERLLLTVDCVPVFQDALHTFGAYLDFCQAFLWPVMNNQLPLKEDTEILQWDEDLWKAYKAANDLFGSKVVELLIQFNSSPNTSVWVNDFHLFLLPSILRRRIATTSTLANPTGVISIGTFIHSPYPTSEIFLTLPVRSEIMRGLLASDLLGFQFYDYTRHFFSGAQRLFGVRATCQKGGLLALEVSEDRNVFIHITHNCIEQEYIVAEASRRSVQQRAGEIRATHANRVIIGAIDKLGRTSGILLKLRAFRQFLQQYTQYQNKVVLILYIVARGPQMTAPEHFAIFEQAQKLADEINAEFGSGHIVVSHCADTDRCALLCVTDILLETSLKDGLNLVPFEYLAARDAFLKLEGTLREISEIHQFDNFGEDEDSFESALMNNCRKTGRIVISEFTGSSQVLPGAIRVNPWNIDSILTALDESLTLPPSIANAAFVRDANYVASQSQVNWAREFSTQIVRAALASKGDSSGSYTPVVPTPRHNALIEPAAYSALPRLNRETVVGAFRKAKTRLLLLDNEGTLAPNLSRLYRHYGSVSLLQAKGSGPSEDVLSLLAKLTSDPRNTVMILSGRSKDPLSLWFDPVPDIGLAAEHGYWWTLPKVTGSEQWRCIDSAAVHESAWTATTAEIMNRYVNRTPNSYIENKGSACVWQFRDAEAEFGPSQAKELHAELEIALRNDPVNITTGKGYVEVKLRGVNKGAAVENILNCLVTEHCIKPEFILCIGDDRSDESMFETLLRPFPGSNNCAVFTSTVGRKKTMAKYFLSDVDHVSTMLSALADESL